MTRPSSTLNQQLTVRLEPEAILGLDKLVEAGPKGLNRSDYIRRAVEELLAAATKTPRTRRAS